jgi:surfeit locus 1 family protein
LWLAGPSLSPAALPATEEIMSSIEPEDKGPVRRAPVPLSRLPLLLLNRQWWWTTLVAIAGVVVLVRLGIWQLDRLDQRRAANAELLQQLSAAPIQITGDFSPEDPSTYKDRKATATGRLDYANQLLLTQQSWEGNPGSHLVTPLIIDGSDRAILVDRGWIPAAAARSGALSQFDGLEEQTVAGTIMLSQTLSRGRQTIVDGPQQEWYRVDIGSIQEQMPYPLLPVYLQQNPAEGDQELPYRQAVEIDLSEGPHLGYAIQWFIFATLLAVGYTYYVRTHG